MSKDARKSIVAAVGKLRAKFKKNEDPGDELFDLLEQALVDLNRIADATEDLERKYLP